MNRWIRMAGTAFAILIMATVLYLFGGDLRGVDFADAALLPGLAGAVALYVLVILIGASAWKLLLISLGSTPAPWLAERHLLVSQIAKYVPGNIAQYLGRAGLAIQAGVPAKVVGIGLVTETVATVIGGILSVAACIALAPELATSLPRLLPEETRIVSLGVAVASIVILLFGASLVAARFKQFGGWPKISVVGLLSLVALYALSFLLLGMSLTLVVGLVSTNPVPLSLSVAVFAAAWIAGLATPGAPGGLGVRESIIALGLAPLVGGAAALSAALLHRGISVVGDVISFGLGLLLPKQREKRP